VLMGPLAQVGLALATSIGAWINLTLVIWFTHRAGHAGIDAPLRASILKLAVAGAALAAVLWLCEAPVSRLFDGWHHFRELMILIVLAAIGGSVYGAIVLGFFGRGWLTAIRARRRN